MVLLCMAATLLLTAASVRSAEKDELLLKTCFPKEEPTARKWEECKDEDCGLQEEISVEKTPTVEKGQRYKFLGGSDFGVIWGATDYRVIGEDRLRFLLFVVTTITTKKHYNGGFTFMPARVIQTAFYSSFGEYRGFAVGTSYTVEKKVGKREEVLGGEGEILMVDLHCSARKMKIYDNTTLYYRTIEDKSKENTCVELLWEKPRTPLQWYPATSITMDILANYYCKKK